MNLGKFKGNFLNVGDILELVGCKISVENYSNEKGILISKWSSQRPLASDHYLTPPARELKKV